MSRKCDLTGLSRMKRNKIAIERSKVTKRSKGFAHPNLQIRTFKTPEFGTLKLKIANKTMRTIEKYGGLVGYLQTMKRGQLTELGLKMRRRVYVPNETKKQSSAI